MKTTFKPNATGWITWFKLGLAAILVFVSVLVVHGSAQAMSAPVHARALAATTADVPDGILLAPNVTEADAVYLSANLEFLRDYLPTWQAYIHDAKPFMLSIDLHLGTQGRAAYTRCCDKGLGLITFGYHFDQLALAPGSAGKTVAARRAAFLAILVHEVTHLRDQRAGRVSMRADYKTCVEAERSGLGKQLQFENDLAKIPQAQDTLGEPNFNTWLEGVISAETKALASRGTWIAYCGDFLD